jgi:hypothetical protein
MSLNFRLFQQYRSKPDMPPQSCEVRSSSISGIDSSACDELRHDALASANLAGRHVSLAVMAQPIEVEDGHAAILQSQQALLLQCLQALVGILPGNT